MKGRGLRPKQDPEATLRQRVRDRSAGCTTQIVTLTAPTSPDGGVTLTLVTALTPPDHRDRNPAMGIRTNLLAPGSRVLFVDDWVDTGGQLRAAHAIVSSAHAQWCGASVVIDARNDARLRHDHNIRALLNLRDL